jgi:hypothetical protein
MFGMVYGIEKNLYGTSSRFFWASWIQPQEASFAADLACIPGIFCRTSCFSSNINQWSYGFFVENYESLTKDWKRVWTRNVIRFVLCCVLICVSELVCFSISECCKR